VEEIEKPDENYDLPYKTIYIISGDSPIHELGAVVVVIVW
jgi:hypothetical protein